MIDKFISLFTGKKVGYVRYGERFYLVPEKLRHIAGSMEPESVGTFLGEQKRGKFLPSIALLDHIAEESEKKITVEDKAAWLFMCGRDIFRKSVISGNLIQGEQTIVLNKNGEVIGLGEINDNEIRPIIDRGDFLRREKTRNRGG